MLFPGPTVDGEQLGLLRPDTREPPEARWVLPFDKQKVLFDLAADKVAVAVSWGR